MSSSSRTAFTAAAVLFGGAVLAYLFKEDIKECFDSENGALLQRIELAISNLERGLTELEAAQNGSAKQVAPGGMRKFLDSCNLDLDFIFSTLDSIKGNDCENIRIRRKALVDRAVAAMDRQEHLQQSFLNANEKL